MNEPMAAQSLTLRLPPEILREILHFLTNDREALLSCALVSQEWLFESRSFFFRTIDLPDRDASDLFVSKVLRSEHLRPWFTSIRHLSFVFMYPLEDYERFLFDMSERLSNLRTMKWDGFRHNGSPLRSDVLLVLGKFPFLHHLELDVCIFASFQDLKRVLGAIPTMTSLTLMNIGWSRPDDTASESSALSSAPIWPTALSKLSVYGPYYERECADDVIIWLSTTPTRHLLTEFSFHIYHLEAALQLMADASLTILDVQMAETYKLFTDSARVARLEPLFSQAGEIEFLRLAIRWETWDDVAGLLRLFGSASSIHRLRLCWELGPGCCLPEALEKPEFSVSAKQLDPILASSEDGNATPAFHILRAVEFAWYFPDISDEILREQQQHPLLCAWVQRTLPRLHGRRTVAVKVYAYKWVVTRVGTSHREAYRRLFRVCHAHSDDSVVGPAGLARHACESGFPHAQPCV